MTNNVFRRMSHLALFHKLPQSGKSALSRKSTNPSARSFRRTLLEPLEERQMLNVAPTLVDLDDVTVYAGTTLHIALDGYDADADDLSYTVTSTNSNLSAEVLDGNQSLKMTVEGYGDMIFELFEDEAPETTARIIELVESGFYDGLTFHRIIESFMIQGGDPDGNGTGGSGVDFDDEFNADLLHTSSGILSMAKSYDDTNDSQFFITSDETRGLDFQHSVFGFLTDGEDVRVAVAAVDVETQDSSTEVSKPVDDVVIESMEVFVDNENGTLRLKVPEGVTGEADVTVTVSDGNGGTVEKTFHVTIEEDYVNENPILISPEDPIQITSGGTATYQIEGWDREGDEMYYHAYAIADWGGVAIEGLDVDINAETGLVTITADEDLAGVYGIVVGVNPISPDTFDQDYTEYDPHGFSSDFIRYWDFQFIPVYITPDAPTDVDLVTSSDTGGNTSDNLTTNDNLGNDVLEFRVSGVTPGATVFIYADGQKIGSALAQTDTVVVQSTGAYELTNGSHQITARQVLADVADTIGTRDTTATLSSDYSTALAITVDDEAPEFTSTPVTGASGGIVYTYDANTDEEEAGGTVTYSLTQSPAGMIINAETGVITWTPAAGVSTSGTVKVKAADAAGNEVVQQFEITVNEAPTIDKIDRQVVTEDELLEFDVVGHDDDEPLTYSLADDAPAGATIDSETGKFQWTPTEEQAPAEYQVKIYVTDSTGLATSTTVAIQVKEQNIPPVLEELDDLMADEGEMIEFVAAASDADIPADPLTFSLDHGAPAGAQIDPTTGRFTFTPNESQGGGTYEVTIRVTDSKGDSDACSFTVTVTEVDEAPVFVPVEPQTVALGQELSVQLEAADPDQPTNAVEYSLEPGAPDGVAVDPSSGELTWSVPEDYPTGTLQLKVRATELIDGEPTGLSSVIAVEIRVYDIQALLASIALSSLDDDRVASTPENDISQALLAGLVDDANGSGSTRSGNAPSTAAGLVTSNTDNQLFGSLFGFDFRRGHNGPPTEGKTEAKEDGEKESTPEASRNDTVEEEEQVQR